MKTKLLIGLGALVVALLVVGGFVGSAFMGNKPLEAGAALGAGAATTALDGFVASYVLDAGEGQFALVDAGMDSAAAIDELRARGGAAADVKWVLLTHGHGDHIGGLAAFPNAKVLALEAERSMLDGEGVKLDQPLKDGQKVQLGALEVEVFSVPGHTPGSAVFLARGVLFFGDSAGASSEGAMKKAVWFFSEDSNENVRSLKALAARLEPRAAEIREMAFGHTGALQGPDALFAFGEGA